MQGLLLVFWRKCSCYNYTVLSKPLFPLWECWFCVVYIYIDTAFCISIDVDESWLTSPLMDICLDMYPKLILDSNVANLLCSSVISQLPNRFEKLAQYTTVIPRSFTPNFKTGSETKYMLRVKETCLDSSLSWTWDISYIATSALAPYLQVLGLY